jgi:hypothetical protein
MTDAETVAQLRRILADVLADNDIRCDPHPENTRCVCSAARARRVLLGGEEW